MHKPPDQCKRCNSSNLKQTGAKTWRCTRCDHRMRVQPSGRPNEPEYLIWYAMLDRCCNPANKQYKDYGGRGISVCERWLNSWHAFVADVGKRPNPKMVLDRIDNDKNYEPGNVRWATREESSDNRRITKWLTHEGRTQTRTQWAREFGVHPSTFNIRLIRGWSVEEAAVRV